MVSPLGAFQASPLGAFYQSPLMERDDDCPRLNLILSYRSGIDVFNKRLENGTFEMSSRLSRVDTNPGQYATSWRGQDARDIVDYTSSSDGVSDLTNIEGRRYVLSVTALRSGKGTSYAGDSEIACSVNASVGTISTVGVWTFDSELQDYRYEDERERLIVPLRTLYRDAGTSYIGSEKQRYYIDRLQWPNTAPPPWTDFYDPAGAVATNVSYDKTANSAKPEYYTYKVTVELLLAKSDDRLERIPRTSGQGEVVEGGVAQIWNIEYHPRTTYLVVVTETLTATTASSSIKCYVSASTELMYLYAVPPVGYWNSLPFELSDYLAVAHLPMDAYYYDLHPEWWLDEDGLYRTIAPHLGYVVTGLDSFRIISENNAYGSTASHVVLTGLRSFDDNASTALYLYPMSASWSVYGQHVVVPLEDGETPGVTFAIEPVVTYTVKAFVDGSGTIPTSTKGIITTLNPFPDDAYLETLFSSDGSGSSSFAFVLNEYSVYSLQNVEYSVESTGYLPVYVSSESGDYDRRLTQMPTSSASITQDYSLVRVGLFTVDNLATLAYSLSIIGQGMDIASLMVDEYADYARVVEGVMDGPNAWCKTVGYKTFNPRCRGVFPTVSTDVFGDINGEYSDLSERTISWIRNFSSYDAASNFASAPSIASGDVYACMGLFLEIPAGAPGEKLGYWHYAFGSPVIASGDIDQVATIDINGDTVPIVDVQEAGGIDLDDSNTVVALDNSISNESVFAGDGDTSHVVLGPTEAGLFIECMPRAATVSTSGMCKLTYRLRAWSARLNIEQYDTYYPAGVDVDDIPYFISGVVDTGALFTCICGGVDLLVYYAWEGWNNGNEPDDDHALSFYGSTATQAFPMKCYWQWRRDDSAKWRTLFNGYDKTLGVMVSQGWNAYVTRQAKLTFNPWPSAFVGTQIRCVIKTSVGTCASDPVELYTY